MIEFLPGNTEAREEAEWIIINRLVESDVRALPEDFLAYWLEFAVSPDQGALRLKMRQHTRLTITMNIALNTVMISFFTQFPYTKTTISISVRSIP